jgi:hypothetical protein
MTMILALVLPIEDAPGNYRIWSVIGREHRTSDRTNILKSA